MVLWQFNRGTGSSQKEWGREARKNKSEDVFINIINIRSVNTCQGLLDPSVWVCVCFCACKCVCVHACLCVCVLYLFPCHLSSPLLLVGFKTENYLFTKYSECLTFTLFPTISSNYLEKLKTKLVWLLNLCRFMCKIKYVQPPTPRSIHI